MPYALYVCLQDDDKIAPFAIDAETGRLTQQTEVPTTGGPSVMASSPDRRTLYVGHRTRPAISSLVDFPPVSLCSPRSRRAASSSAAS